MIDLRKYILDDSSNPFCRLIKEVIQRTHCNTLSNIEAMSELNNPDVLWTVALNLSNNLLQGFELEDYGEWGEQNATEGCLGYGAVNPLLYALVMSVFEESQVSFKVFEGTESEVAWAVINAERVFGKMPDWEREVLEYLSDAYQSALSYASECFGADDPSDMDTGLSGSILLLKFDESCNRDAKEEFLRICGEWIPQIAEGMDVYGYDCIGYEPSYTETGLDCDLARKSEELLGFLEKYGHRKKRKIPSRTDMTVNRIVGELKANSTTNDYLIRELLSVKETRMEVML